MIPKWAKHYGKGKKSRQDMETKCGMFIDWLRRKHPERQKHDNMAKVTFEDGRDWLEAMLDGEGGLSPGSIKLRWLVRSWFESTHRWRKRDSNPRSLSEQRPAESAFTGVAPSNTLDNRTGASPAAVSSSIRVLLTSSALSP
jgi:hypothetical protein